MAYIWGDSWDCYAAPADAVAGYWDSGTPTLFTLVAGRFAGSQALQWSATASTLTKSGANDALHHFTLAIRQTAVVSGTTLGHYFTLFDGIASQCSVVFRQDGAILLTSGAPGTAAIATYTGAITAQNTWYTFEIEVLVSPSAGYMNVRKNGNTVNDFASATNLNTRANSASLYANKLTIGLQGTITSHQIDDLLWRSDAASVPWVGDVRCYARMPASDASAQFARAPNPYVQTAFSSGAVLAVSAGDARYTPFTAAYDGTIASATVSFGTGYTGNLKCSIFALSGGVPTTVLGSANILVNPVAGPNTITFGTPVTVVKNGQYFIGFDSDTASGSWNAAGTSSVSSATPYASFPVASPGITSGRQSISSTVTITPTTNYQMVNETLQDGTTTYVYDAVAGHADFYNVAALPTVPASTVAVTTRAFVAKGDAGTRTGAVQLKSGATTVASPTLALSTSFGWTWRTDTVDPATSTAWTAAAVSACTIGPAVIA